jgi:hypothetical protein
MYPLKPSIIEPVLRANMHIIDDFAWMTRNLNLYWHRDLESAILTDYTRLNQHSGKIVGVSPALFNSTLNDFLNIAYENPNSGLSLAE